MTTVFISYSRKDAALVHLLEYALSTKDIKCFFDRKILPGREFSPEIHAMIKNSDVFLVLWTDAASKSNWVNQEIGYATGLNKTIIPIGIEKDNYPKGMLSTVHNYPLFDYECSKRTVNGLVKAIESAKQSTNNDLLTDSTLELDLAIIGREQRTQFIIDTLKKLNKEENEITVYCQAAFSTFAIMNDEVYRRISGHPKKYMDLLIQERDEFTNLINKNNVELRMIFWPVRAYAGQLLEMRYKNLIDWMNQIITNPPAAQVNFVCSQYIGYNRMIIRKADKNFILLEGIKRMGSPGYEVNIVTRNENRINNTVLDFESIYQDACIRNLYGEGAVKEVVRLKNEHLKEEDI